MCLHRSRFSDHCSPSLASNALAYCRSLCQIWCESIQKWQSYCHLIDFKMSAAAILDFCTMWICGKSDCGTPFSSNVSNSVQMHAKMDELWPKMWFSIWRPPPSLILLDTSSEDKSCLGTLFSVSVSNLVWSGDLILSVCIKFGANPFKNGGVMSV